MLDCPISTILRKRRSNYGYLQHQVEGPSQAADVERSENSETGQGV